MNCLLTIATVALATDTVVLCSAPAGTMVLLYTWLATDTMGLSTLSATPLSTSPPAIFILSFIEVLGSAPAWLSTTLRPVLIAPSICSFPVDGIKLLACLAAYLTVCLKTLEAAPSGFPLMSFSQSSVGLPTYPKEGIDHLERLVICIYTANSMLGLFDGLPLLAMRI